MQLLRTVKKALKLGEIEAIFYTSTGNATRRLLSLDNIHRTRNKITSLIKTTITTLWVHKLRSLIVVWLDAVEIYLTGFQL